MAKIGRPKTGYFRNCAVCHTPFWVFPNWAARRVALYCSHKCAGLARRKGATIKPLEEDTFVWTGKARNHWLKKRGIEVIEMACGRLFRHEDVRIVTEEELDTDACITATCQLCLELWLRSTGDWEGDWKS